MTTAGMVTRVAGGGTIFVPMSGYQDATGTGAKFSNPIDVAVDSMGVIYVTDSNINLIRKITAGGNDQTKDCCYCYYYCCCYYYCYCYYVIYCYCYYYCCTPC